jgi:hypothetical protein
MQNRRAFFLSLAATAAVAAPVTSAEPVASAKDGMPKATLIKGTPAILDFGGGLKIPCAKSAFLVLWEGESFWLTLGAGRSSYAQRANGMAVLYAIAAMKLLLMTLAFAPERLKQEDGGWRLKEQAIKNYVLGDVELPGKPYWPVSDAGLGFGDMDMQGMTAPGPLGQGGGTQSLWNQPLSDARVDAFTTYIVQKKDLSLDDVRIRAKLLSL